jgi:hypothetical protein
MIIYRISKSSHFSQSVLHVFMCVTIDGVEIELDLLTTGPYNSELQVITALSLVATLYKSLAHAKSSQFSLDVS